jgi:Cu+-exporting ATPase
MSIKTTLSVKGMTCASCAQGITKHLNKQGFKDARVFYETGEVDIECENSEDLSTIISEIKSLGYSAAPKSNIAALKNSQRFSLTEKRFVISLLFTLPLLLAMFLPFHLLHNPIFQFLMCIPVIIIGLQHFGKSAYGSIINKMPNMDVLIALGSITAFIYSTVGWLVFSDIKYMFFETSATIITLVLLGNIIEERSLKKTHTALEALTKIQPPFARRIVNALTDHENTIEVDASLINPNDLVLINTGDKIPVDGQIYWGNAVVDVSAITGESLPIDKTINDQVLAGSILLEGSIKVIVQKSGASTILSQMIELVKNASFHKPSIQRIGDKISAKFVPIVILIALGTFLISVLIFNLDVKPSLLNSIAVLVISCPCAMGLATPTAVAVGIGRAARNGILIKGGDVLERLSEIDVIVFDKTGTLTEGNIIIEKINYFGDINEINSVLFTLEQHSTHPIASSIISYLNEKEKNIKLKFNSINEEKGLGIFAIDDHNNKFIITSFKGAKDYTNEANHQVYLIKNEILLATIDVSDSLKSTAKKTIDFFRSKGIKTILLSGDSFNKCKTIAHDLMLDEYYAEKLPLEKAEFIKQLNLKSKVAMVGDGINDAAAISAAYVGIAMGKGTDLAIATSDIVLINSKEINGIDDAYTLSKSTIKTIKSNLFWALIYNVIAIPIAAFGFLSPMIGSLSMAFSDVVVIGNSLRLRNKKIGQLK